MTKKPELRMTPETGAAELANSGRNSWHSTAEFHILLAMELLARISVDPGIRFGKASVRGTRITVGEVLGYLANGSSEAELLAEFPQLTHDDLLSCFAFAAERERRVQAIPAA